MIRTREHARFNWEDTVSKQGLIFHTVDGQPYWDETASYSFTPEEIDVLENATNELHALSLKAVQYVIDKNLFPLFGITPAVAEMIRESWHEQPPNLYGRFDLAYMSGQPPKMLEYNADTPTVILEASIIQWFWLQEVYPDGDQFNSLHERLVAAWKKYKPKLKGQMVHFGSIDSREDVLSVTYLEQTANEAGITTKYLDMIDIGWCSKRERFVDLQDQTVDCMFKLYPWEWMMEQSFADELLKSRKAMDWIEPAWKMLLSNKAILPILWELFPNHPNLLEAYFDHPQGMTDYVRKPLLSREGANIEMFARGLCIEKSDGIYGNKAFVCQKRAGVPCYDGNYPIIGSWVIDGEAGGMGIRESKSYITNDSSRFVPHRID